MKDTIKERIEEAVFYRRPQIVVREVSAFKLVGIVEEIGCSVFPKPDLTYKLKVINPSGGIIIYCPDPYKGQEQAAALQKAA